MDRRDVTHIEKTLPIAEGELGRLLEGKNPLYRDIEALLTSICKTSEEAILQDFFAPASRDLEKKLWDLHVKVNGRYRKLLSQDHGKRRPVEERQLIKHFIDFTKIASRFYRSYLIKVAVRFRSVPELQSVVQKFKEGFIPEIESPLLGEEAEIALISCHETLLRLGDLSRYRETEAKSSERNWGPAMGYYDLANAIRRDSGAAFNQMAVLSLADGNHVNAMYYLYRALCTKTPFPTAENNLDLEFRKILNSTSAKPESRKPSELLSTFLHLHAICSKQSPLHEVEELENEMISLLAVELKELSVSVSTLCKMVLINVSAEYLAGTKLQKEPSSTALVQRFFNQLRVNVKTVFTLLQVLQHELQISAKPAKEGAEKLTAVARRLLPALRHYSSWMSCNANILAAQLGDAALIVQKKELWKMYANSMTLFAATFQVSELPKLNYLLEEDEDTLGFQPFEDNGVRLRYTDAHGAQKPDFHQVGTDRCHPNLEMRARVRDLLTDGLDLALQEGCPIILVDTNTFAYEGDGLPEGIASPKLPLHETDYVSSSSPETRKTKKRTGKSSLGLSDTASGTTGDAMRMAMHDMVDDLVGDADASVSEAAHMATPTVGMSVLELTAIVNSYGSGRRAGDVLKTPTTERRFMQQSPSENRRSFARALDAASPSFHPDNANMQPEISSSRKK